MNQFLGGLPIPSFGEESEDVFQQFVQLAGCADQGLDCLRKADIKTLMSANHELMQNQIESLLLSHCSNEAVLFLDGFIATNADFDNFLTTVFANHTADIGLNQKVADFYPEVGCPQAKYKTQADRRADSVRDSSMACNIRYLTEAYGDSKVWNMQYSVSPGWHAMDLVAVFYNKHFSSSSWNDVLKNFVLLPLGILLSDISAAHQSYLASYTVRGDPGVDRVVLNVLPTVKWNHPRSSSGENVGGVVGIGNFLVSEVEDGWMRAGFGGSFYAAATAEGGYVAPGGEVSQGLVGVEKDIRRRYEGIDR
ncbi:hypothetical protein SAPIO_CDS9312 [Scedosporium apiospermum]|uniref:Carboxylesterase type B domain-containing protein n=1 Tax=Pseudallescheria apiosperma TaxID=563466 RepID=A0A084FWJ1_PSEDA|nr:uncharacterized protein SAPIO_CDS9312 [Scedosporium apiospermum]KEZ39453.1 hypothetical protein SAPIO_CDS9312 [Scedosporium apiospermum]